MVRKRSLAKDVTKSFPWSDISSVSGLAEPLVRESWPKEKIRALGIS